MPKTARKKEIKIAWTEAIFQIGKGAVLGGLVILVMLLGGALLVAQGLLPETWGIGIVYSGCVCGCLIGGVFAGKQRAISSMLAGTGVAVCVPAMLLFAGTIAFGPLAGWRDGAGIVCACFLGGGISILMIERSRGKRIKRTKRT